MRFFNKNFSFLQKCVYFSKILYIVNVGCKKNNLKNKFLMCETKLVVKYNNSTNQHCCMKSAHSKYGYCNLYL